MAIKKAVYEVPNAKGTDYDEIHFKTDADMVGTTDAKNFVSFSTDMTSAQKADNAVINANQLGSLLGHCKIVISDTKPAAEAGYNILWIDLKTLSTEES